MLMFTTLNTNMVLETRSIARATRIVPPRNAPWRRELSPTIPVVKGCFARDALPHTFNIGEFKSTEKNSALIEYISNECENIIEGCYVAFYTNDCWNSP